MSENTPWNQERFDRLFARHRHNFLSQEGLCFYCRQLMSLPDPNHTTPTLPPDRVTREHLLSRSQFLRIRKKARYYNKQALPKRHAPEFIVAACNRCNNDRGSKISWQSYLLRKIEELWAPK